MFSAPTVHVPLFEQAYLLVFKHEEIKGTTEGGVDGSIRIYDEENKTLQKILYSSTNIT
jgi:hypothetical protein